MAIRRAGTLVSFCTKKERGYLAGWSNYHAPTLNSDDLERRVDDVERHSEHLERHSDTPAKSFSFLRKPRSTSSESRSRSVGNAVQLPSEYTHYNTGRPHSALGPGVPDPPQGAATLPKSKCR